MSRFNCPFPIPIYIPYGNRCITAAHRPALDIKPRADQSSLFSFSIPISAPHRLHFKIKSGQRPIDGVINCTFVSIPASMIRPPHFGHRTGRIRFFISCFHSSFFMHIEMVKHFCNTHKEIIANNYTCVLFSNGV